MRTLGGSERRLFSTDNQELMSLIQLHSRVAGLSRPTMSCFSCTVYVWLLLCVYCSYPTLVRGLAAQLVADPGTNCQSQRRRRVEMPQDQLLCTLQERETETDGGERKTANKKQSLLITCLFQSQRIIIGICINRYTYRQEYIYT